MMALALAAICAVRATDTSKKYPGIQKFRGTDVCMTAPSRVEDHMHFDTDSKPIKIDNCCTRTMSHSRSDFVSGTLVPT
jgi:hypothetical protein